MTNTVAIIIVGVYTLVYLIVFFIQKAQIDNLKSTIESMKVLRDLFKVDELVKDVDRYADMKHQTSKMEADKYLKENEATLLKKGAEEAKKELTSERAALLYHESVNALAAVLTIVYKDEKEREDFIKRHTPLNAMLLIPTTKRMSGNQP